MSGVTFTNEQFQQLVNHQRGMLNLLTSVGGGTPPGAPSRPLPGPRAPSSSATAGAGSIPSPAAAAKTVFTGIGSIAGLASESVLSLTKHSAALFDQVNAYGRDRIGWIVDQFGAVGRINAKTGQMIDHQNETTQQALNASRNINAAFYDNYDRLVDVTDTSFLHVKDSFGNTMDVMEDLFLTPAEAEKKYFQVTAELADRQAAKVNELTGAQQLRITAYTKGMKISEQDIGKLLDRQISRTGEASTQILDEVTGYAHATSEATGASFGAMTNSITGLMTNVQTFGNLQAKEAAKISGVLYQLGIDYQSFGKMVNKFMNFDTAATSMGNLTAAFGIHLDAMDMMMMAVEDPAAMLGKVRNAFEESGQDIMDMNIAQKNLLASQLGMGVRDIENFFQTGRLKKGISELDAAVSDIDMSKSFEKAMQSARKIPQELKGTDRDVAIAKARVFDRLTEAGYQTATAFDSAKSSMRDAYKITEADIADIKKAHKHMSMDPETLRAEIALNTTLSNAEKRKALDEVDKRGQTGMMLIKLYESDNPKVQKALEAAVIHSLERAGDYTTRWIKGLGSEKTPVIPDPAKMNIEAAADFADHPDSPAVLEAKDAFFKPGSIKSVETYDMGKFNLDSLDSVAMMAGTSLDKSDNKELNERLKEVINIVSETTRNTSIAVSNQENARVANVGALETLTSKIDDLIEALKPNPDVQPAGDIVLTMNGAEVARAVGNEFVKGAKLDGNYQVLLGNNLNMA